MNQIASRETLILLRAKREVQILEAVINVTTPCDRLLMDLGARQFGMEIFDCYWLTDIRNIRNEFTRLRRRKGRDLP